MKICPGCQREVADDAAVCECGLQFEENAGKSSPNETHPPVDAAETKPENAPAREQAEEASLDHGVESEIDESDMDETDLDEDEADASNINLDETDLDSEEVEMAEADLDQDTTEEVALGAERKPEEPVYSRRERPKPQNKGPLIFIIGAHAVLILAAFSIFYYKSAQYADSGGDDPPDYNRQQFVTEANSAARVVENNLRGLGLAGDIALVEKDSPASPEAKIVIRMPAYRSVDQLRQDVETDAVQIGQTILKTEPRVHTVQVEIQAQLANGGGWEVALSVAFERAKGKDIPKGEKRPHNILLAFGAVFHPALTPKK